MEKEAKFVNFKKKNISDLPKIISEKNKTELKTFKIESLRTIIKILDLVQKQSKGPERRM